MITNGYCSLDEAKTWSQIDDEADDWLFEMVITAASRNIERHTNRPQFWLDPTPVARVFSPTADASVLKIQDLGSATVTIKTDTAADSTFATTLTATQYRLEPENNIAQGLPVWQISGVNTSFTTRVQVTGRWGFPAEPTDVKLACLLLVARFAKRRYSVEGAVGFNDFGVLRIKRDDDVADLLEPFRLVTVGG